MSKEGYEFEKEYMPEDDNRIRRMDNMMQDIYRWLQGDPSFKEPGLIEQFKDFKLEVHTRLLNVENTARRNTFILIGIAVGAAIASLIFGVMTIQQLKQLIK